MGADAGHRADRQDRAARTRSSGTLVRSSACVGAVATWAGRAPDESRALGPRRGGTAAGPARRTARPARLTVSSWPGPGPANPRGHTRSIVVAVEFRTAVVT